MEPLNNRNLTNFSSQQTDKIQLIKLPPELLITIFSRLKTFNEMTTWSSTCRKFRQIFQQAKNWEHSIPFEKLLHDIDFNDWKCFEKILFGSTNHAFSRELATLFFNQADDEILKTFMCGLPGKNNWYKRFLNLLIPENLSRTTLKTWPHYDHDKNYHPLKLISFLKDLKHLKILTQGSEDEDFAVLAQVPELETLFICVSGMTEKTLEIICKLKKLKTLELETPLHIPPEKLSLLETTQLEYLVIRRYREVQDEHLKFVGNMPALKEFKALNCVKLSSKQYIKIISHPKA